MITAKQKFIQFYKREGRYPTLEEWKEWGFTRQYYYQIRNQVSDLISKGGI